MADLLAYYMAELEQLRRAGAGFAQRYPTVAARLDLGAEGSADPQVERLIESFAFLTGRLRRDLDGQFPDIARALLELLYPQLVTQVPAMGIAEFVTDPQQARAAAGLAVPRGTMLYTLAGGASCAFRTAYPVPLLPIRVTGAGIARAADLQAFDGAFEIAAVLVLDLAVGGRLTLGEIAADRLRFHLHGPGSLTSALYDLVLGDLRRVVIEDGDTRAILPPEAVSEVGFAPDEALLPYPPHAHDGYRLLQEYFAHPAKYRFFEIGGLAHLPALASARQVRLMLGIGRPPPPIAALEPGTFRLGCTPVINLFSRVSEPVRVDQRRTDYPLAADTRRSASTEIHSVLRVTARPDEGASVEVEPFFSFRHAASDRPRSCFWLARRLPCEAPGARGSEHRIAFVDAAGAPSQPARDVLFAQLLCTSRGAADAISAGAAFEIEQDLPLSTITCLGKPTPQRDTTFDGSGSWRLISQLGLNHLSLEGGEDGLVALKEILGLYAGLDPATGADQLLGLVGMRSRRVVGRVGDQAWRGFCQGVEIELELDEERFAAASPILMGAVLSRFFGLYAGIDGFARLVQRSRQRETAWRRWPARAGATPIL